MKKVFTCSYYGGFVFSVEVKNAIEKHEDEGGEVRVNDNIVDLIMSLKEKAFKDGNIPEGFEIVEFDDSKIHPIIGEEEFGGETLDFAMGSLEEFGVKCVQCMTYNPGYYPEDSSSTPREAAGYDEDFYDNSHEEYVGERFVLSGSSDSFVKPSAKVEDNGKKFSWMPPEVAFEDRMLFGSVVSEEEYLKHSVTIRTILKEFSIHEFMVAWVSINSLKSTQ